MNSFVLNFRRAFARGWATLFAGTASAADWRVQRRTTRSDRDGNTLRRKRAFALSLNCTNWSSRVLIAILALAMGGTAVAGTYPASYIFRNNVYGAYGPLYVDSESAVCSVHLAYWNGTYPGSFCENVNAATYTIVVKSYPEQPVYVRNTYNVTRIYYCSGLSDVLNDNLTCAPPSPLTALDDKNAGYPNSCVGNPVNPGTGSKAQEEIDYVGQGAYPLVFKRFYNATTSSYYLYRFDRYQSGIPPSLPNGVQYGYIGNEGGVSALSGLAMAARIESMTAHWRTYYDRTIEYMPGTVITGATLARPEGKVYRYTTSGGLWSTDADIVGKLTWTTDAGGAPTGWQYANADDEVENYDATGRLVSIVNKSGLAHTLAYDASKRVSTVTDSFGHQPGFAYDGSNRISTLTDPAGDVYTYAYDAAGNLASVTYPDNTPGNSADNPKRIYLYNESANTSGANLPNALTGLTDENGTRFATWKYDTTGRAISSEHAGAAEKVTLAYDSPSAGQTTVSDYKDSATTANVSRTYGFSTVLGVVKKAPAPFVKTGFSLL